MEFNEAERDVWFGKCPDMVLCCEGTRFHVNRAILMEASPVWMAMLNGPFQEGATDTVHLEEDCVDSVRIALTLLYSPFTVATDNSYSEASLDVLIEKYDLEGLSALLRTDKKRHLELVELESQLRAAKSEIGMLKSRAINERMARMERGNVVDYRDYPDIGTRVKRNYVDRSPKRGRIIANDEDGGTESAVRWDDGSESHHLHCCKKGGQALKYL